MHNNGDFIELMIWPKNCMEATYNIVNIQQRYRANFWDREYQFLDNIPD